MKSIGITTIHNCQNNYGGALQCFALYEYLRSIGYNVEVIDLRTSADKDFRFSVRYPNMRMHISTINYMIGCIKEILGIRRFRKAKRYYLPLNPTACERFNDFNAKIKLSRPYFYIPDLYKNPPRYDIYITGSDQLWNPTQPYCLEPYFLTYVKDNNALKISYGTSIGITDITDREKKLFKRWLASYDAISVREEQARKMLQELTGQTIYRVPDPTFLLEPDKWLNLSVSPADKDYILIFNLGQNKHIIQIGIKIAQDTGRKVKVIDQNYSFPEHPLVEVVADAGPLEFIGLIRNAWLVLTNSFHCTVFSIITGTRNFYTYIAKEPPMVSRGSRIVDLLARYDLSNHIVYSLESIPSSSELNHITIDTVRTSHIIGIERNNGRDYIKMVLSAVK